MRAYYFGEPNYRAIRWAYALVKRWRWTRFVVVVPAALILFTFMPVAWLLFKLGQLGVFLAHAIGVDPYDKWD